MRKTLPVTITLHHDAAERLELICSTFGGKVATFAGTWVNDLSELTPEQLRHLKDEVRGLAKANKAQMQLSSLTA